LYRWPLYITVFTNSINIALDLLLVIGLDMKSDGAAIATLIAEYSGCGLGLIMIRQLLANTQGKLPGQRLWRWQEYQQLLLVNRHLFVRTLLLLASFAFFTAQGASQGTVILSANAIMMNFLLLTSFGLDGFAHAAEALIGKAVGNRDLRQFKATCFYCCIWSLLTALVFSLLFLLAGDHLIQLLTSLPEVRLQAARYLPWLIALPLIAVWSYLLDGIFIGATQTRAMQNTMLAAVLLVYLPCWYLSQPLGNHGLWLAFVCFNAARGVALTYCFVEFTRQQRWWPITSQNRQHFISPL
jgi:MATE family multidrug resistance protein